MIPINLLPHREVRRKAQQRQFGFLAVIAAVVGIAIVTLVHGFLAQRIDNQQARNRYLDGEITKLDKQIDEIKKLKEQPDQVLRMLKAMSRALKYIQENPEGTQQVMMNWLKLDREMAADIYQMAKNNYTKNGMVEESMLNSLVTTMLAEAGIKNVAPTQLVDFTLLQQVLK